MSLWNKKRKSRIKLPRATIVLYCATENLHGLWSSEQLPFPSGSGKVNRRPNERKCSKGHEYPLGGDIPKGLGRWGLNESVLRQVDGCQPRFAIASKQVASPSSFFTRQSPWRGTASPLGPIPSYTQCLYTHTCSHSQTHQRFFHDSQSLPAPRDWECKQSLSRLNPGVSFPFRPSSHTLPSPSVSAYNTDGIVFNSRITFSLSL